MMYHPEFDHVCDDNMHRTSMFTVYNPVICLAVGMIVISPVIDNQLTYSDQLDSGIYEHCGIRRAAIRVVRLTV